MGRHGPGRKRSRRVEDDGTNGFGDWGGYMNAKKSKLLDQFHTSEVKQISNIFAGVAIYVNGLTRPPIDELKNLMAAHGGTFHAYQVSRTTHIIASNLPYVKIKRLGSVPVVKPSWITDSIDLGKLLDYRRYLLYTNQGTSQPSIQFPIIDKASTSTNSSEISDSKLYSTDIFNSSTNLLDFKNNFSDNESDNVKKNPKDKIRNEPKVEEEAKHIDRTKASTKTASDPNFLEEFYNNSRLHLISTLGAEFKHLVGQLREKSNGKFPGKDKLVRKGTNLKKIIPDSVIMHIDMDCFFVSVGLRNHPELKGKPVAITHARNGQVTNIKPDQQANREQEFALYSERLPQSATSRIDKLDTHSSMSEIASCSYEARKCGVRNGMFLGQATKLCPDLKTLSYDFEGYKEVSHTLYNTIASYTLDIEAVSCDEMYVDVTNILKETGITVEEWATHIRNEITEATRCPCSTGFGANRLQARIATRKAKPNGQFYLKPDDVEMYMSEIPLADLPGVGRATLAKLSNLGLNTCGDLQVVSLKVLQSELGQKAGETLKDQARGLDRRPLNFHHERKSVSAEVNYGIRFKTLEECYNFLQSLSNEVYKRLSDINMRARCLTLKLLVRAADAPLETAKYLGHGVCDALTKSVTNIVINDPQIIFREVKTIYDKLNPPFADLRGLGIQLTKLEKNATVNTALSKFLKQKPIRQTNKVEPPKTDDGETEKLDSKNTSDMDETKEPPITTLPKSHAMEKSTKSKSIVNSLNKYFSQTKGVASTSKSTKQADIGKDIDLNVLKELPEELRKEIIEEYQLNCAIPPRTENDVPVEPQCPDKIRKDTKDVSINRSPFTNLSWDQMKVMIKQWVSSADSPEKMDTLMIAQHLKQYALDRNIELLFVIFNFLHRIFSTLNCNWHSAYFTIVNVTQEGMMTRYGAPLMVKKKFDCCQL